MRKLKKEKTLTKEEFVYFMNKYKTNLESGDFQSSDSFNVEINVTEKRSYMNPEPGVDNLLQRNVDTQLWFYLREVSANLIADLLTSEASLFGEDISWVDKFGIPPTIRISYKDNNANYPLIKFISDRELYWSMDWDPENDFAGCKEIVDNFRKDHFKSHVLGLRELESQREWECTYTTGIGGYDQPKISLKFTSDPLNNGKIKLEMTLDTYDESELDKIKFSEND